MKNIIAKLSLRTLKSLKTLKSLTALAAIVCCQTSCVKETLYDTDHPNHGKIISLTTDWTDKSGDIAIPGSYTVKIGDYTTTLLGTTNEVNNYFEAGTYHINIWNTAEHIAVSGTTATADYSNGLLGWFFTGTENVTVEKDKDHAFTVPMHQQVRQLTLELEITGDAKDRLTGIEASLSGVAGAISIDNGNPVGDAAAIALDFTRRDAINRVSTIRLLGITGNVQTLTLTLHFEGGNPSSYTVTSDLASGLAAFNADKKTPLTLHSILVITPTQTGFTATIDPWIENGGNVIAN
ncbi:hypothetical protein FACS189415_3410 [Bacteroidia bacterium]|nr:hypothetical protein AGMMS49574_21170 [Bacteroidia bacterium]GHU82637.1 hypothetical protein FACS189415_3410 [Bacteroidia bacterium]